MSSINGASSPYAPGSYATWANLNHRQRPSPVPPLNPADKSDATASAIARTDTYAPRRLRPGHTLDVTA